MQGILKHKIPDFTVEELLPDNFLHEKGTYRILKLTKTGMNTEDALQKIAKTLHTHRKNIGYCGNKDKQAKTTQYITLRKDRVNLNKLKNLHSEHLKIEPVGYSENTLSLGMNAGNSFSITLRNLPPNFKACIPPSIPNYFDEQRFSKNNVEVGRALIQKDFKNACKIALERTCQDPISTLRTIPLHNLLMYIHAYQAYIWNETVTRYLAIKNPNPSRAAGNSLSLELESIAAAEQRGMHPVQAIKEGQDEPYSKGILRFPRQELHQEKVPLVGFMNEQAENRQIQKIIDAIMEEEKISNRSFIIRQIPELTCEGAQRDLLITLKDLQRGNLEDDEEFPGRKKIHLRFALPPGSYATIVIKAAY